MKRSIAAFALLALLATPGGLLAQGKPKDPGHHGNKFAACKALQAAVLHGAPIPKIVMKQVCSRR